MKQETMTLGTIDDVVFGRMVMLVNLSFSPDLTNFTLLSKHYVFGLFRVYQVVVFRVGDVSWV